MLFGSFYSPNYARECSYLARMRPLLGAARLIKVLWCGECLSMIVRLPLDSLTLRVSQGSEGGVGREMHEEREKH